MAFSQQEIDRFLSQLSGFLGGAERAPRSSSGTTQTRQAGSKNDETADIGKAAKVSIKAMKQLAEDSKALSAAYKKHFSTVKANDTVLKSMSASERQAEEEAYRDKKRAVDEYTNSLGSQSESLDNYSRALSKFTRREFVDQVFATRKLAGQTTNFTSQLAKSQINSSLLASSLLGTYNKLEIGSKEYEEWMSSLEDAASGMGKSFLSSSDIWDETTKSMRDNLAPEDFQKLRLTMGSAQTALSETFGSLSSMGISSAADVAAKVESGGLSPTESGAISAAAADTVKQLHAMGIAIEGLTIAEGEDAEVAIRKFTENLNVAAPALAKLETDLSASAKKMDGVIIKSHTEVGASLIRLKANFGSLEKAMQTAVTWLGSAATFNKGVGMLKSGGGQAYKEGQSFNIAQLPITFADVQLQSMRMGLSFEQTVDFLNKNRKAMAVYGKEGFADLRNELGSTFKEFGYSLSQSAEMIAPAITSAIDSGSIDISKKDELNGYIKDTMDSFSKISNIVDTTASQYFALNSELFKSEGVNNILVGLDKAQAKIYRESLVTQRDLLLANGITLEQANEQIKQQQALLNQNVSTRIKSAGNFATQAGYLGMSNEDVQKGTAYIAAGDSITPEQRKELQRIFIDMETLKTAKIASQAGQGIENTGNIIGMQTMFEHTDEGLREMQEAAKAIVLNQKTAAVPNAANQPQAIKDARGNTKVAEVGTLVDSVNSAINNSFVTTISGATLAVGSLAASSTLASISLGKLAGGGILSKAGDILGSTGKSVMGGLAGIGGSALKVLKGGGAAGLAGIGADILGNKLSENGYNNAGAATSVGGAALSGAGTGALLGSFLGPLGTAGGAAIGGTLGGLAGLYQHWDEFGSPSSSSTPAVTKPGDSSVQGSVNNIPGQTLNDSTKIDNAADNATHLLAIAENTTIMAKLLQQMFDSKFDARTAFYNNIPSVNQAMTNTPVRT